MKSKLFYAVVLLATFSFSSSFALENTQESTSVAPIAQEKTAHDQKDGEVIAWLVVLNTNEIAAANEALHKNTNPMVKSYAAMLKRDHTQNLQKVMAISRKTGVKPVENEPVTSMKEKGKEELSSLKSLNNKEFQTAYIDAMVKGHEEALGKVETDIKETNNPQLKKHLEATKGSITRHLEHAKSIQSKLQANS